MNHRAASRALASGETTVRPRSAVRIALRADGIRTVVLFFGVRTILDLLVPSDRRVTTVVPGVDEQLLEPGAGPVVCPRVGHEPVKDLAGKEKSVDVESQLPRVEVASEVVFLDGDSGGPGHRADPRLLGFDQTVPDRPRPVVVLRRRGHEQAAPGRGGLEDHVSQFSNRARTRGSPRGFSIAGRTTHVMNTAAAASITAICRFSFDLKCPKSPLLDRPSDCERPPIESASRPIWLARRIAWSTIAWRVRTPFRTRL